MNLAPELQRRPPLLVPPLRWSSPPKAIVEPGTNPGQKVFGHASAEVVNLLGLMASRRKIRHGALLYREHDRFEFLYAVHSGSFKSTLSLADGCQQVNNFYLAGEVLGLDGVADGRHASGAFALEDSVVSMVSSAEINDMSAGVASVHPTVVRLISREIVRGNCHMVMLGSLNSAQRLAAFLLSHSESLQARGYSPLEFHLKMTRSDIGSFLGLTLETVSRMFSELQQQRLLKVERRHIVIADLDGLSRV